MVCLSVCLQRSSRGRTLKPASFSHPSTSIHYSYDMRGNFIGLDAPVVDLTLDTSGFIMSDSLSVRQPRQMKRETDSEKMEGGGDEGESVGEGEGGREGEVAQLRGKKSEGKTTKKRQKRVSRVIPLELSRKKVIATAAVTDEREEGEEGGEGGGEREEEKEVVEEEPKEDSTRKAAGGVSGDKKERARSSKQSRGRKETTECERGPLRKQPAGKLRQTDIVTDPLEEKKKVKRNESKKEPETGHREKEMEVREEVERGEEREGERWRRGENVAEDCLVTPGPPTGVNLSKVKVHHKEAKKKRVSISNEVVVMGAGRRGGGEEEGEKGEGRGGEWSSNDRRKLSRYEIVFVYRILELQCYVVMQSCSFKLNPVLIYCSKHSSHTYYYYALFLPPPPQKGGSFCPCNN